MTKRNLRLIAFLFALLLVAAVTAVFASPSLLRLSGAAFRSTSLTCEAISQIPASECAALQAIYDSTGGPSWSKGQNWFQSAEPCTWYGVSCNEEQNHVISLYLQVNQMTGALPAEIARLTELQRLQLPRNQLGGPLTPEFSRLSKLTYVDLSQNQITGTLSLSGSLLTSLEVLNLSYNQMSGPLPASLGDLPALKGLFLNYNQFSGPLPPEIGKLAELRQLYLAGNQFDGPLPPEMGQLNQLTMLRLEGNRLAGVIPAEWSGMTALEGLYVQDNLLNGPLPHELSALSQLKSLAVSSNAFTGPIPDSYAQLTGLGGAGQVVDLGYNGLFAENPTLEQMLAQHDPAWAASQTVAPTDLQAFKSGEEDILLTWTPILYTGDGGYYEISYAKNPNADFHVLGMTTDKSASSYIVQGLDPDKHYAFRLRTYTPPHADQKNELWSDYIALPDVDYRALSEFTTLSTQKSIFLPLVRK